MTEWKTVGNWGEGHTVKTSGNVYRIYDDNDNHIGYWCCQCSLDCKEIVHGDHFQLKKKEEQ